MESCCGKRNVRCLYAKCRSFIIHPLPTASVSFCSSYSAPEFSFAISLVCQLPSNRHPESTHWNSCHFAIPFFLLLLISNYKNFVIHFHMRFVDLFGFFFLLSFSRFFDWYNRMSWFGLCFSTSVISLTKQLQHFQFVETFPTHTHSLARSCSVDLGNISIFSLLLLYVSFILYVCVRHFIEEALKETHSWVVRASKCVIWILSYEFHVIPLFFLVSRL